MSLLCTEGRESKEEGQVLLMVSERGSNGLKSTIEQNPEGSEEEEGAL